MPNLDQLVRWLEDDAHAGCAEDLMCAAPEDRPRMAREIADHCERDRRYDDGMARALPGELRAWADEQEGLQ
jgi:hypothetical protein